MRGCGEYASTLAVGSGGDGARARLRRLHGCRGDRWLVRSCADRARRRIVRPRHDQRYRRTRHRVARRGDAVRRCLACGQQVPRFLPGARRRRALDAHPLHRRIRPIQRASVVPRLRVRARDRFLPILTRARASQPGGESSRHQMKMLQAGSPRRCHRLQDVQKLVEHEIAALVEAGDEVVLQYASPL